MEKVDPGFFQKYPWKSLNEPKNEEFKIKKALF
jgi:hypothetical protein